MSDAVTNPVEVRRVRRVEWRSLRSLRLEALQDSPLSYGSTHEVEVLRTDEEWRQLAAAGAAGDEEVAFAAIAGSEWIGMARGYLELPVVHLIAVYVTPDWRHRGIGHAVSQAVVDWARERRASAVLLSVSDWNEGARRVYESLSFVPTGVQRSLPWNPSIGESEMRLELD